MERSLGETKISVIIPVYNAEKYLKRCMNSVLSQTYRNFEIVCIDDGSTDNSGVILDYYANSNPNIEVVHIENKGVGNARNLGIKKAKGDFIFFIDADDTVETLLFEKTIKALDDEPADILIFDVIINNYGRIKKGHSIKNVKQGYIGSLDSYATFADYFFNGPRIACNRVFSRSFLQKHSLAFSHLRNGEDGIFIIEAYSKANKIIYLPYAGYNYIFNKSSATQAARDEKFIHSICLFYDYAQKLPVRFTSFDYMKVINTHFLNAYITTVGDFIIGRKSGNRVERKKQFDRMLAESPYDTALKNIDYSYLSAVAKISVRMGRLTYGKMYFMSMIKKVIKNIIRA